MPVKDNQAGVDRLLDSINECDPVFRPNEVIVVDNNSSVPLRISRRHLDCGLKVRLLTCRQPGAAAARNFGAAASVGKWLLFTDSDCISTPSFISGFLKTSGRAVAYAGSVVGAPANRLARFYDSERALMPRMKAGASGIQSPMYIVTANAIVWKKAFELCGGFNQGFAGAGGEDVEFSIRLWQLGSIECAPESIVVHDFSDGFPGLWRRYKRYGQGNRTLERIANIPMAPKWSAPADRDLAAYFLKLVQYMAMRHGYYHSK